MIDCFNFMIEIYVIVFKAALPVGMFAAAAFAPVGCWSERIEFEDN